MGLSPLKGFLMSQALHLFASPKVKTEACILFSNIPKHSSLSLFLFAEIKIMLMDEDSVRRITLLKLFLNKLCPSQRILALLTAALPQLFQNVAFRNGIRPLTELSFKCIYQSEVILKKPQYTYALIPCLAKQCKRYKPEFSKNKSSRINPPHSNIILQQAKC